MAKNYIIHFSYKYQNFWKAELDSILKLFHLNPNEVYDAQDLEKITSPFIFASFKSDEDA